ncbi:hypothetical protein FB479_11670 [Brevibacillus sp. AG162]|uniref:hypothetical protein n=1 Tax=Brevibacillus sp. AG162 TaxID=2572910 RepID=UPI001154CA39|nr:hypothetical protein [Brevibacillus sp. AG162]TQK41969.1 hypothetical protein FB479_11670 [Brevibacillus sp. AG162]
MPETKVKNPFMATKKHKSDITGTEYTFQKVAPRPWLKLMDEWDSKGKTSEKLTEIVLEHIVVEPRLNIDDFEDYAELDEVTMAAFRFQRGK